MTAATIRIVSYGPEGRTGYSLCACGKPIYARCKQCRSCDSASRRRDARAALPGRLAAKTEQRGPDECWPWHGRMHPAGYGAVTYLRTSTTAHRLVYELAFGPVPIGLQIDHLCRNRACVNPAHLEAVTQAENIRRGDSATARNGRKTVCVRGHSAWQDRGGRSGRRGRRCTECNREDGQRHRAKLVAA